jgi:hypothetical protein
MGQEELVAAITRVAAKHQAAGCCYCYLNYDEVALPAIWRWATSSRRDVPQDDLPLRILDLAKELTLPEASGRRSVDERLLHLAAEIAACMPPDPVEPPPKRPKRR